MTMPQVAPDAAKAIAASAAGQRFGLPLALRLAWRDLRGGLAGFRVFLACLALGVGAIAAILSISRALEEGASAEGRSLLGGDLSFSVAQRQAKTDELAYFRTLGPISTSATLRSMARAADGTPGLVELKAADDAYPLYGKVTLEPAMDLAEAVGARDGIYGVVVEPILLTRLGLGVGDSIDIGESAFEIRAVIAKEPDRISGGFSIGPRALVSLKALAATDLVQPGSLVRWHYKLALPDGTTGGAVSAIAQAAEARFPASGWRIRSRDRATPGVSRFTDRVALFLSLLGLSALLVGGVGVANATAAYLEGKSRIVATMKCLGATSGIIFSVYLIEVLVLAVFGIAIGVVVGGALPIMLGAVAGDAIPIPARFAIYAEPLVFAAAAGLLTAFAFSLWPLGRAQGIRPAALFRDAVASTRTLPHYAVILSAGAAIVALAALVITGATDKFIASLFVGGAFIAFVLLAALGRGLMALMAVLPRSRVPEIRIGMANLYRPGAATPGIVLSLGLGLSMLVMVGQIDANLQRELGQEIPERAPSFFFVDIRQDQLADFKSVVAQTPTAENLMTVPMLRARVSKIKGVDAAVLAADAEHWVLHGDRGITYAAEIPQGSKITAGKWWPADYKGPQLVSVTQDVAHAVGLDVGDTVTLNVLGRDIRAEVANIRSVDWRSMSINFVFVFSPGVIETAPHANLATVEMEAAFEGRLIKDVVARFPNITAVSVKDAIEAVSELVANLMIAIRAGGGVAVLTGALVLGGAIAAGRRSRVYDAVVLKTFGATRRRLVVAYLVEFGLLGLVTGIFAAFAGSIAAYFVLTRAMDAEYVFMPGVIAQVLALGIVATLIVGFLGTWRALGHKAADVLRSP
ncbi:ABC transporter, fused permease protein [hydrothermal vent metagenome]|uniref:ABC transporter, fused permease protein n=1 Tax=hydrothermal vent metagenome TaxID=652676 RepID=A0A3B0T203_9ZZZZ